MVSYYDASSRGECFVILMMYGFTIGLCFLIIAIINIVYFFIDLFRHKKANKLSSKKKDYKK